ncbi:MAG: S9 family peptidase [Pseudomonadota bacterium]
MKPVYSTTLLLALAACICASIVSAAAPAPSATGGRIERGNLVYDGIPPAPNDESGTLARYLETRSASIADWLADGSLVISTRFGNTLQLHRLRTPMGYREQLTFHAEPVANAVANPYDVDSLLFLMDKGGNENHQIYLRNLKNGGERLLTDGKSLNGAPAWAHDGKRVAFYSTLRDGASYDIYVVDTSTTAPPRLVVAGNHDSLEVQDWSLDDNKLLLLRYVSATESYLELADTVTGARTAVEPAAGQKGPMSVRQARFARDGRGIFFLSDHGGEFAELRYVDMFTGEQKLLAPQSRGDAERFDLSVDGRYIAYTLNEGGLDRLVLHDLTQQADVLLPALPNGALIRSLRFSRGKQLAITLETAQSPADIYVLSLDAATPTLARWTQSELGPIDFATLVAAQRIVFPTWDQQDGKSRQLDAFVYSPRTPGPHPVVIDIHGGPESQSRPGFSAFTQYLVNELGYVVIAPNVRGSSGYGRSFLQLDDGMLREDSVRDIGSLLVWIGLQREFDRNKVVVMGGSYGGYMALSSLAHYDDRLAGGVDVVGISNFVTFLTNTSAYRRDQRRNEYGDERDPKMRRFLQDISPATNAKSIRKPLLIVQGLNDPRVPASESEQMLQQLRLNGTDTWYLAAKDEGHGFRKKANRDVYLATVAQFLRQLK